jgi:hypothetical protein
MVAEDFEAVLKGKYPAKAHAKRVVEIVRKEVPDASGLLYLEGRHTKIREDDDSPEPFRYAVSLSIGPRACQDRIPINQYTNRSPVSADTSSTSPVSTSPTAT